MSAAKVFIDSSAFIALFNRKEQHHQQAEVTFRSLLKKRVFYTSDYILDEVVTFTNTRYGHVLACQAVNAIAGSSLITLLVVDRTVMENTIKRFCNTSIKGISFTDISSTVLMDDYKIAEVFAFDNDFVKLGYKLCS